MSLTAIFVQDRREGRICYRQMRRKATRHSLKRRMLSELSPQPEKV
ncbi:hypothetical protein A675_04000 [Salmonella enterica subsp. enterica serovar Enteritidis str. 2009K1726]|nr:hypothetical protein A671_04083 [Salmonella enterica subsp. enterica serovar Dublin str. DG22]EPI75079.1 hypothetical protein A672_01212 [Salmonella enterica subsp. enterica serovar Enteritidis str. 08-1080]EPI81715.1 hypothetical protein A675_04000 [Salmonella enterica subsp. enterica serovar Enteritidis str. 2009K1726]EPI99687.1 hypothetical protein A677_02118 [Salmonella enterica subsp. enterica serovar Enteritidis str. 2010K-0267]EPJ01003.1 hypothetical protein A678_02768 [Salmonella ent